MGKTIQLQVSNLKKQFGTEIVLDGINLSIHKGEVVVASGNRDVADINLAVILHSS